MTAIWSTRQALQCASRPRPSFILIFSISVLSGGATGLHGLLSILRTWDDIFWSSDGLNKQTLQLSQWTCWKRYVVVNHQSIPFSPSMYVGFRARRQDALLLGGCLERTLGLWWHCWLPKIPLLTDSSSYLVRYVLFLWIQNVFLEFVWHTASKIIKVFLHISTVSTYKS